MSLIRISQQLRRRRALIRARLWGFAFSGVSVGAGVRVGSGCRLRIEPGARLVLADGCEVDDATTLAVYAGGTLDLGARTFVGHHCTLAARSSVRIGAGAYLAELVSIRDHDHEVGAPPSSGAMSVEPVEIGPDAWIGAKVTVLRGARIGEGAVVGANAVVRGELPSRTVSVGIPARVMRVLDEAADGAAHRPA